MFPPHLAQYQNKLSDAICNLWSVSEQNTASSSYNINSFKPPKHISSTPWLRSSGSISFIKSAKRKGDWHSHCWNPSIHSNAADMLPSNPFTLDFSNLYMLRMTFNSLPLITHLVNLWHKHLWLTESTPRWKSINAQNNLCLLFIRCEIKAWSTKMLSVVL